MKKYFIFGIFLVIAYCYLPEKKNIANFKYPPTRYYGERNDAGEYHGEGVIYLHKKGIYVGKFENGELIEGNTTMSYKPWTNYYGQFKNYEPHGVGIITEEDGSLFAGNFRKGIKVDGGVVIKSNGEKSLLNYDNGKLNGL